MTEVLSILILIAIVVSFIDHLLTKFEDKHCEKIEQRIEQIIKEGEEEK